MHPKILDKIFQPFTAKPTRHGTGLGLSLSYDVVIKGHGGELRSGDRGRSRATCLVRL
ncbi:MAG: ATP-binding protein [Chryseolinea sp.]